MQNILPQQAGLTVSSVVYRYTAVKNAEDNMIVYVSNKNAQGDGYIFREADDWSGLPGNKIYKVIGVADVPIEAWGDGSISVEGFGTVENPSVIYNYRYDPCFDPQSDPSCPGYKIAYPEIPVVEAYDVLQDEFALAELERQVKIEEEEEYERRLRIEKVKENLEEMLGGVNTSAMSDQAAAQEAALIAMNYIPTSYLGSLNGGVYNETLKLVDGKLPDNKEAKRVGLAQQLLHEKMVEEQY